jgi:hypothetical protein
MSFGRAMAFHPLIDMLRRNFRIEEGDTEGTIVTKVERGVLRLGEDLRPRSRTCAISCPSIQAIPRC